MIVKLNEQEIEDFLKDNIWGHLGCNDGFNTYVYPINYLYDGKHILFHSQVGTKIKIMRQNNRVCFQVEDVESYTRWTSVMIHGEYQEVTDERERLAAMTAFFDRRLLLKTSRPDLFSSNEQDELEPVQTETKPAIYRVLIDEKMGRYERE